MTRKPWPQIVFVFLILLLISCGNQNDNPNILFISVDDLRPELGCYGNEMIETPNIDRLAAQGSVFMNHYVQVPTCGASRYSLLTGMRPRTRIHLKNNVFEKNTSNQPEGTIPESFIHHLKRNGYYTIGIGKISHSPDGLVYGYTDEVSDRRELPHSWSELVFNSGKWSTGWKAFFGFANGENGPDLNRRVKPYEKGRVEDDGYVDGLTAQLALEKLRKLKKQSQPFFLGVGFFKPHLPFNSPEKYWDLYDHDSILISPNPDIPKNVNKKSLHGSGEFNRYELTDEKANLDHPISENYAKTLKQGYFSCVSYVDQQIGKIMDELRSLNLDKNTIVIIWGDHGWHLGDQQMWGKHTLFDNALKSTLIIKRPGTQQTKKIIKSIVETVDIYPSVLELCNIDIPGQLDGNSFVQLLDKSEPSRDDVAYSYFNQGISLRTNRYRLTKFYRQEKPNIELYDHLNDPYETINIAGENMDIVNELMPLLDKGDTGIFSYNSDHN